MITVTYAIDNLDPKPAVETFDTMDEAQDWISEEMESRVDWIVSHSPHTIDEDELDAIRETEWTLVRISED